MNSTRTTVGRRARVGRWAGIAALAAGLAGAAPPARAQEEAPETRQVTAKGEGTDEREALDDALRKAVEQGAGVVVASRTETLDNAVAFDKIIAKASGYVKSYTVKEKGRDGGAHVVTIEAVVSTGKIQSDWAETQMLIEKKGRPTVMVLVRETIVGKDGKTEESPTAYCAQALEELFTTKGFKVKSVKGLKEIERRERDAAVATENVGKLAQIAANYGANVMITGDMTCKYDGEVQTYGMTLKKYLAVASLQAYATDTAEVIASVRLDDSGKASGDSKAQDTALKNAVRKVPDKVLRDILNKWYSELQHGEDFEVEVTIVAEDASLMKKAEKVLETFQSAVDGMENVKDVLPGTYIKQGDTAIGKLVVKTTLDLGKLKSGIRSLSPDGYSIELTGSDKNTLKYTLHIEK
ncbi:MAG: hypothetical protein L0216_20615 [Planctomycetales bacterium]|nr:hypothetical protein [Planctomycetales bacterium]